MRILEGFGRLLGDVAYLLVEVQNRGQREDSYSVIDVCAFLKPFDFRCSKVLYSCYDGPTAPAFLDVLFWRYDGVGDLSSSRGEGVASPNECSNR